MTRRIWPLAALLTAVACSNKDAAPAAEGSAGGAAPATASSTTGSAQGDEDLADVASYRLTMDKLDRYFAAQRNMALRMKAMSPAERAALEREDDGDDTDAYQSLDDMARKIERNPVMGAAVREAGLSAREFSTITIAMVQSAMAAGVLQMRPNDNQDSLVREMKANMDNIKFLRANEAALKQKQEAFAAEMKRLGVTEQEEESGDR